jgi:molybdate transport repressor ModE-like protein/molybdopterin-binding protein
VHAFSLPLNDPGYILNNIFRNNEYAICNRSHLARRRPGALVRVNRFTVTVESCDARDSHAWISLGRTRLAARRWDGIRRGQKIDVQIRPEDVLLCDGHPGRVSARNVLPGHVTSMTFVPGGVRVDLEVGFPLSALVTRAAAKELRIRRGAPLFAIIKAVVVTPEVEVAAKFRVSAVGAHGILGHERVDFMKAIQRSGSLSAAAKDVGITYRTAWIWAREINETWAVPLIARTHGGKGGGGTALTPEGRSILAWAARIESAV